MENSTNTYKQIDNVTVDAGLRPTSIRFDNKARKNVIKRILLINILILLLFKGVRIYKTTMVISNVITMAQEVAEYQKDKSGDTEESSEYRDTMVRYEEEFDIQYNEINQVINALKLMEIVTVTSLIILNYAFMRGYLKN